jgi:hypothetical protein
MQPSVQLTVLDGALGILAPSDGDLMAVVGPASSGPFATPAAYARGADIIATYTSGPAVEAACLIIQLTGKPVVFERTATSTAATHTTIDVTGFAGTATPTIDGSTAADDDYEVYLEFVDGGTLGVDGITYVASLDKGRTLNAQASLGTASSITIPTPAGLVKVDFAVNSVSLVTLANDLRTEMLAHFVFTTGSVHLNADTTSDDGFTGACSDLTTAIALLNTLRAGFILHEARVGSGGSQIHLAADAVNGPTAPVATDGPTAVVLANDLRTKYAAHLAYTVSHTIADATNGTTAPAVAATDIIAGDVVQFSTAAATWNNTDLGTSLTALAASAQPWNIALIVGKASATAVQVVDAWLVALAAKNKFKYAICNTRLPDIGESDAAYQASLGAAFGSVASRWVDLAAGSCKLISAVTQRDYRRPVAWIDAVRALQIDAGQDLAEVDVGPLPACSISDANGNPDDHDESVYPGLDDQRFTTLRTIDGFPGVYINNARIFSPTGSDFIYVQFRRVMNLGCTALVQYLTNQLSTEIVVDKATGKISKGSAAHLEAGGTTAIGNALYPKKRASNVSFVVSRDDNILSTFTLTCEARITPNGYVKTFATTIGFFNPAIAA